MTRDLSNILVSVDSLGGLRLMFEIKQYAGIDGLRVAAGQAERAGMDLLDLLSIAQDLGVMVPVAPEVEGWRRYQVPGVLAGERGRARVEHCVISIETSRLDEVAASLDVFHLAAIKHQRETGEQISTLPRFARPGPIRRFSQRQAGGKWEVMMSDTHDEIVDHYPLFEAVERSRGPVLLLGLGLGVALNGCILAGAERVDVVEIDADTLALTGEYWRKVHGARVNLIQADAREFDPRGRYAVAWNDIWLQISDDNLREMRAFEERIGRASEWTGSWARRECERMEKILKIMAERKALAAAGGDPVGS